MKDPTPHNLEPETSEVFNDEFDCFYVFLTYYFLSIYIVLD